MNMILGKPGKSMDILQVVDAVSRLDVVLLLDLISLDAVTGSVFIYAGPP